MKNFSKIVFCILSVSMLSGCATLFAPSKWPLKIDTKPEGAWVKVINRNGDVKFEGTTPATVFLPAGRFYFKKETYTVKLVMAGAEDKSIPVGSVINTYYWLNFLWGGLIGFVLIDPASGAMYQLDRESIEVKYNMTTGNSNSISRLIILIIHFYGLPCVHVISYFNTFPVELVHCTACRVDKYKPY